MNNPLSCRRAVVSQPARALVERDTTHESTDWRMSLPVLTGRLVTLRELETADAPALQAFLSAEEVARLIAPPPTVEGFERFIERMKLEQQRGVYVCYAVVPHGQTAPVGLFQVHELEPAFRTAEWGFVLGSRYWGTGMFMDAARLVVDFAFDGLGVHRLEARAALVNGRGNGALKKLGAVQEATLRRAFICKGEHLDLALWSILRSDWRSAPAFGTRVRVH